MAVVDGMLGMAPAPSGAGSTNAPGTGPVVLAPGPAAAVLQAGVILDWEDAPADPAAPLVAGSVFPRLAHVRPNNARGTVTVHWPLLEAAWLDGNVAELVRCESPLKKKECPPSSLRLTWSQSAPMTDNDRLRRRWGPARYCSPPDAATPC